MPSDHLDFPESPAVDAPRGRGAVNQGVSNMIARKDSGRVRPHPDSARGPPARRAGLALRSVP